MKQVQLHIFWLILYYFVKCTWVLPETLAALSTWLKIGREIAELLRKVDAKAAVFKFYVCLDWQKTLQYLSVIIIKEP